MFAKSSPPPQSPLVDAASALVLLLRSCHRAARHTISCSPPTGPPSSSSSPLPPFVQYFSFPLAHVLPRILALTPQRIRRTPSGPAVHLISLSAARQGVSGPRVVQPFLFTRHPPPGRRIRTAGGPGVHLHSLSAARKAIRTATGPGGLSSLAIRRQEGLSGPRVVQAFIFTHYPVQRRRIGTATGPGVYRHSLPPPGGRIRTPSVSGVHPHSLSAARKAYPDRDWSRRSSSLAIRCQEGVSGPRLVQAFIVTRYPPPGGRLWTPSGPGVHPHSLSAARKAYRDPEWSRR